MKTVLKKSLSRRHVLKGMGVSLGLPLLDAMIPAFTKKAWAAVNNPYFLFMQFPHGTRADRDNAPMYWNFNQNLAVLEPLRNSRHLSLLSNLDHGAGGDPHNGSLVLTGDLLVKNDSSRPRTMSFDQYLADNLPAASSTRYRSLALGVRASTSGSLVYRRFISWRPNGANMPKYSNPRDVFNMISGTTPPRDQAYESILDTLQESYQDLSKKLGSADQRELDHYLESVRELERQLENLPTQIPFTFDNNKANANTNSRGGFESRAELMIDLALLALRNGSTNIITIQFDEGGNGSNSGMGFDSNTWHDGESSGGDMHHGFSNVNQQYNPVQQCLARLYKRSVDGMLSGNIWDRGMTCMTSEAGRHHVNSNVEMLIAGGLFSSKMGAASMNMGGQHTNRFFVSLAQAMGLPTTSFSKANTTLSW